VQFVVSVVEPRPRVALRCVGVDLGISTFAALSDGGFIPSFRAARRAEGRLRKAQRALARKKQGSRGRRRARSKLAACHAEVARSRSNFLHQASARLVREYDAIAMEALDVQGLASSILAKDVRDAAWSKFISSVRYKAARAGARVVEVNPADTTQGCSGCGRLVWKVLGSRVHSCPNCGLVIDRDLNAARNILDRAGLSPGLRNVVERHACRQEPQSGDFVTLF